LLFHPHARHQIARETGTHSGCPCAHRNALPETQDDQWRTNIPSKPIRLRQVELRHLSVSNFPSKNYQLAHRRAVLCQWRAFCAFDDEIGLIGFFGIVIKPRHLMTEFRGSLTQISRLITVRPKREDKTCIAFSRVTKHQRPSSHPLRFPYLRGSGHVHLSFPHTRQSAPDCPPQQLRQEPFLSPQLPRQTWHFRQL